MATAQEHLPPQIEPPTGNPMADFRSTPDKTHLWHALQWGFAGGGLFAECVAAALHFAHDVIVEHIVMTGVAVVILGLMCGFMAVIFGLLAHFERKAVRERVQEKSEKDFAATALVFEEQNRRHKEELAERDKTIGGFVEKEALSRGKLAEWSDPEVVAAHVNIRFTEMAIFDSGTDATSDELYLTLDVLSLAPIPCKVQVRKLETKLFKQGPPGASGIAVHKAQVGPLFESFDGSRFVNRVLRKWEIREKISDESTVKLRAAFDKAMALPAILVVAYTVTVGEVDIDCEITLQPLVRVPPRYWAG